MRLPGALLATACAILLPTPVMAQPLAPASPAPKPASFPISRIPAPSEPHAIPLYPNMAAGGVAERWAMMGGQRIARNVTRPTITPVLPDPAKATGAAVIVVPGGAYLMLAMDNEGWSVARWLADRGIAAFVLKYRLNETPDDEQAFMRMLMDRVGAIAKGGPPPREPRAVEDALHALRWVRTQSAKWGVDPARVGMIGFSAGARTAVQAAIAPAAAERPAFFGAIYGSMAPLAVPDDAPPMFNALALDDSLYGRMGFGIVESWHRAGRPVELHAYERGEHGFGLGRPGTTSTMMMDQFHAWMRSRGLLTRAAAPK